MTEVLIPEALAKQALGGRYKVTQLLGSSAFSDTYLAKDTQLPNRPICVVKCLKTQTHEFFNWQRARGLFHGEAQALYRLSPHSDQIPRLLAHFEENQRFYLVHDYIEGQDLSHELILGQPLEESQVIQFIRDVLNVLAVVHGQGVIHRDIKPQNLIRRPNGRIALIDFGAVKEISNQVASPQGQTTESILIGTPGYMAAEQRAGKPRFCSDIYSVGMIAIQALTGLHPKEIGEDRQGELCWRQVAKVSPPLAQILTRMVRSHWRDRYQSVQEVLVDLKKLQRPAFHILPVAAICTTFVFSFAAVAYLNQYRDQLKTILPSSSSGVTQDASLRSIKQASAVSALAMHPQSEVVVSGGKNKMIQLWNIKSGTPLSALTGHLQEITALHFTPDGETLVSASADATAKIWDLQSGTLRHTLVGHEGRINSVHVSPDGQLTITGGSDRLIKLWDIASGSELQTLSGHTGSVNQIEISGDGRLILSASDDKTVKLWDLPTGKLLRTLMGHESVVKTVGVNDTVIASGGDDQIIIWDRTTGQRLRSLPQSQAVRSLTFSKDGRSLLSAHSDGTVKLWDWQTGKRLQTLRGHSDGVSAIVVSPNNRTVVTGGLDYRLGIWKVQL